MSQTPDNWKPPLVVLIGTGMGKDDLSAKALQWIARAEVLAGGRRHLEWFPGHPGRRVVVESPLDACLDEIRRLSKEHRTAILASGDPLFFGIGRRVVESLGCGQVHVLPNVTSVQALFARLSKPWEEARVLSLHGRETSGGWIAAVRAHPCTVLFTDARHTPAWIAAQLIESGVRDRSLVVAEDLGQPSEKVQTLSLEEARSATFSPLNLVALLADPQSAPEASPIFGLPESAFAHEAGLITKAEIRAVALAQLQLAPGLILWDLGAASGSVGIEASRIAPLKEVIAVERHPDRYRDLCANIGRLGYGRIRAVHGSAAEAIAALPDPDRVFIGGSGADLPLLLAALARRLRPGGRIVQSAVTLETLETVRAFWAAQPHFETSISQIQVSRSAPIGQAVRLEALNPVFLITTARG